MWLPALASVEALALTLAVQKTRPCVTGVEVTPALALTAALAEDNINTSVVNWADPVG